MCSPTSMESHWKSVTEKSPNTWKLNNTSKQSMGQREKSQEKFLKIHWVEWKWKYNISNILGHSQSSTEKEIYTTKCVYLVSDQSSKLPPQQPRKTRAR